MSLRFPDLALPIFQGPLAQKCLRLDIWARKRSMAILGTAIVVQRRGAIVDGSSGVRCQQLANLARRHAVRRLELSGPPHKFRIFAVANQREKGDLPTVSLLYIIRYTTGTIWECLRGRQERS